ncbi:hypothetical protein [Paraglaciecola sp. T6c]|uniref:hypothetical protein n=1 Tax=Pseudoalteromonas atlantica (strain T6c / ATCC BAA-1087) TaxID=3042615 RepID=UPI0003125915|nr:hypothetical protein [Paraglaciecola sp. T6c]
MFFRGIWGLAVGMLFAVKLQAMPEQCLQSSARDEACPHLIYKKSPVDIKKLSVKSGDMICLCLSDLPDVRGASEKDLRSPELQVTLSRFANDWGLSESELLLLIRK